LNAEIAVMAICGYHTARLAGQTSHNPVYEGELRDTFTAADLLTPPAWHPPRMLHRLISS
jgi:hypothetical protein